MFTPLSFFIMKPIELNVTLEQYFRNILISLKPLPPFNQLRERELMVLSQLLMYNYKYRDLPKEERFKLVFDYDTRIKICNSLNISKGFFDNILTMLRTARILKGKTIRDQYLINPETDNKVTYKFNIKIDE